MKTIKLLMMAMAFAFVGTTQAQTADEIIANYFENTGGEDAWGKIESAKYIGKANMGGMEFPYEQLKTRDGKEMIAADVQGMKFYQNVYNGQDLWGTNQMSMQAEKMDAETTSNFKYETEHFPNDFYNYKEKGYTVELVGNETIEGTDTFKIKLNKLPLTVEGKEVEYAVYYYFDKDNFVPIVAEREMMSGPGKGMTMVQKFSDYEEIEGVYFPMSINIGVKGQPGGQELTVEKIELNPEITDEMFAFPEKQ